MDQQSAKPEESAAPKLRLDRYGWGVFAGFLLFALIAAWFTWRYQESRRTILFLEYQRSIENAIQGQFDDIRSAADRAQTLFVSSQVVEKSEWDIFVSRMRQSEKYDVVDELFFVDQSSPAKDGLWRIVLAEPNGKLAGIEGDSIAGNQPFAETLDSAIRTRELTINVISSDVQFPLTGPGLVACFPVSPAVTDGDVHLAGCVVAYSSEKSIERKIAEKLPPHFGVHVVAQGNASAGLEILRLPKGRHMHNCARHFDAMIRFDDLPMTVTFEASQSFASEGLYTAPAIVFTGLLVLGLVCGVIISYIIDSRRAVESLLKQVESRNAELERFTYTVSHDLKSPLITIRGFVGALKQDLTRGDQTAIHEDMDFIASGCASMSSLLDDLLELSRIGRVVNPTEKCHADVLVQDAIRFLDLQSAERGIDLKVYGEPVELEGDRVRLVEAIQNLLDNAAKFANPESPKIRVNWITAGNRLRMTFTDNGPGVPPAFHEKVFGLFEKLDPKSDGTGIGLAIVRRIIEHHHGRIYMEPANAGARFIVELPLRQPS
ncbi:HAMP domain-containing histidine kinase [Blastopirellula sp. J2-11]|uniref:sensor histidine kinase n=1 Tax=Blastopirellula sp. J2-11 TaxID=2943192 RepID=UPI0021C588DC|nr:HAMP domain-containing sensor histidine kinase [Blastopirellula sp. J2-11]UUO07350.1 HAMP domain-containing histidine kinase [Blastopirellula sp. J2-11]